MVRRAFPMSTVALGIQLVTVALQAPSTPLTNPGSALLMAKSADTDGCPLLAHIDVERAHSVPGRKSFLIKTRDQYGTDLASFANRKLRKPLSGIKWLALMAPSRAFVKALSPREFLGGA